MRLKSQCLTAGGDIQPKLCHFGHQQVLESEKVVSGSFRCYGSKELIKNQ